MKALGGGCWYREGWEYPWKPLSVFSPELPLAESSARSGRWTASPASLFPKPSPSSDAGACLLKWNPHLPHPQNEARERERERETTKEAGRKADFRKEHLKNTPSLTLEINKRSVSVPTALETRYVLTRSLAQLLITAAADWHHAGWCAELS